MIFPVISECKIMVNFLSVKNRSIRFICVSKNSNDRDADKTDEIDLKNISILHFDSDADETDVADLNRF